MSSSRALRLGSLALSALCLALLVTTSAAPAAGLDAPQYAAEASAPLPELSWGRHRSYVDAGGEFRPDDPLTRGELAGFIARLLGGAAAPGEYFPDAPEGSEHGEAMAVLRALGLMEPDGDGLGRPDEPVGLASLRELLGRLTGGARRRAVSLAYTPDSYVTRAQAVGEINRALGRSADIQAAEDYVFPLFDDVPYGHPAYYELLEAAVEHSPRLAGGEVWAWSEDPGYATGFNLRGTELYYIDPATLEPLRGGYVGELYFGEDGAYTSGDDALDAYVQEALAGLLEPGMTRWEALRAAYDYTRDSFSYLRRNYYLFRETGWAHDEAMTMFETGRGNCYCYAAVFYYLARQLGYNCIIISGRVGTDGDPHGWVEMQLDGRWQIFDPELEMAWREKGRDFDFFDMNRSRAPWPYTK